MKTYGLIVADNGGNWYISGAPDERMPDEDLNTLKRIKGRDFEAVLTVDSLGHPLVPVSDALRHPARFGLPPYASSGALRDVLGRPSPHGGGLRQGEAVAVPLAPGPRTIQ